MYNGDEAAPGFFGVVRVNLTIALLFLCSFFAYLIKGTTGFGDAIVFISTASLFYNPAHAVPLILVMAFLNNTYMAFALGSWSVLLERKLLLSAMVLGIIAGAVLFANLSNATLRYGIAGIVMLVAVHELIGETADENRPIYSWVEIVVGVFSGLCGGLFGMAGPPLAGYVRLHKKRFGFRRSIVPFFAIVTGIACLVHAYNGAYASINYTVFGATGVGLITGTLVGIPLLRYVHERLFSILVALFLLGAVTGLIFQG